MKTKNILICGLIGTLIGGGSYALDTSEIKAKCEQSDKTVWVEATKVCVPKNPCENDKYSAYCDKEFAKSKFVSLDQAELFVKLYLLYSKNVDGGKMELLNKSKGQDYIAFYSDKGNYTVFEINKVNVKEKSNIIDIGEQNLGYCDKEHRWIRLKLSYMPEMCWSTPMLRIRKDFVKGPIDDIAKAWRNEKGHGGYTGEVTTVITSDGIEFYNMDMTSELLDFYNIDNDSRRGSWM